MHDDPSLDLTTSPSLVGRARELTLASGLLLAEARLLTLAGPGGVGKTTLAQAVAAEMREHWHGTVGTVNLAHVTRAEQLLPEVAHALGLQRPLPADALEALELHVQVKGPLLLVLDNLEQLSGAAAEVARLLDAVPIVRVLATSRAPLHLPQEHVLRLEPLACPPEDHEGDPMAFPSVQLYVTRARENHPGFVLNGQTARAVGQLCRRLDGLPLAILLAASRASTFPPDVIVQYLQDRPLPFGNPALGERQRTLHGAIGWSYAMLPAQEQVFLQRLAVFGANFGVSAAQTVTDADALGLDALQVLVQLADHGLVSPLHDGTFRLPGTVRDFALGALRQAGEEESVRSRHARRVVERATRLASDLERDAQLQLRALSGLEELHGQARDALTWLLIDRPDTPGHVQLALSVCHAFVTFWARGPYAAEGRAWLSRTLTSGPLPPAERLRAELDLVTLLLVQSDVAAAAPLARDAVRVASDVQPDLLGTALLLSARASLGAGDVRGSLRLAERAREVFREAVDRPGEARAACAVAEALLSALRPSEAATAAEEALAAFRSGGHTLGALVALRLLAQARLARGDVHAALTLANEALTQALSTGDMPVRAEAGLLLSQVQLTRGEAGQAIRAAADVRTVSLELGDAGSAACAAMVSAHALLAQGEVQEAAVLARDALNTQERLGRRVLAAEAQLLLAAALVRSGDPDGLVRARVALRELVEFGAHLVLTRGLRLTGAALVEAGDAERGARALGAAWALRVTAGGVNGQDPPDDPLVRSARDALGDARFKVAWREGMAVTPQHAAGVLDDPSVHATPGSAAAPPQIGTPGAREDGPLSPREHDVLLGVVAGLTNKEIARDLGISPNTVRHHVVAIFEKLECRNRADAVRVATARGLV